MDRLLIVEDEKLIRQGIRVILEESPLQIGEIYECSNGEQAWELMQIIEFDAVLTDIKMPKIDGVALVGLIDGLKRKPHVVVISGYDDFSFAVEVMRHGGLDYILKPVNPQKLLDILMKIDGLLMIEKEKQNEARTSLELKIRYLLSETACSSEDEQGIHSAFDAYWNGNYKIYCTSADTPHEDGAGLLIRNQKGTSIFIATPAYAPTNDSYSGVSDEYSEAKNLRTAFNQSMGRRKKIFFQAAAQSTVAHDHPIDWSRANMEQYTHFLHDPAELLSALKQCASWAYENEAYDEFMYFVQCVSRKINRNTNNVPSDVFYSEIYRYRNIEALLSILERYIVRAAILQEQESISRQKIRKAIRYIHENYNKPLDMAVVSNLISMNYTLFSNIFKAQTGLNFVSYLRNLRVERAKHYLRTTDKKVKEIGKMVGYDDEKHFLKVFKNTCGITPKEYQANMFYEQAVDRAVMLSNGYTLVFNDDFDRDGCPDTQKWTFDIGNNQWANKELQAYSDRPTNAVVKDGKLIITSLKEKDGEREYTSARIRSKQSWMHGRIEVSAKLPSGAGSWPAIWMLPDDIRQGVPWPLCGEIDIMEHVGRAEDEVLFSLHSKLHNHTIGTQYTTIAHVKGVCDAFHVYSIDWSPTEVVFQVDGITYAKYSMYDDADNQGIESWPFNKPFFLIMNIAVGGVLGGPVDEGALPYIMEIDYVRVYQKLKEDAHV